MAKIVLVQLFGTQDGRQFGSTLSLELLQFLLILVEQQAAGAPIDFLLHLVVSFRDRLGGPLLCRWEKTVVSLRGGFLVPIAGDFGAKGDPEQVADEMALFFVEFAQQALQLGGRRRGAADGVSGLPKLIRVKLGAQLRPAPRVE